jgi:molybdenum cofactor cytidylyltransferase
MARYTLELVSALSDFFHGIFLVTAFDPVAALASDLDAVKVIQNRDPQRGQRESVRLGVEAALAAGASKEGHYLFFPCDQPFLDAPTVERIIHARREGRIVQPCHKAVPGNPCLFSAVFTDELLSLASGEHPRDIKKRHPEALLTVELPDPLPLMDFDDPQSLSNLAGVSGFGGSGLTC